MAKETSVTARVASSTTDRPSSVISARVVRRSVGWATRRMKPWASRRSTMLVTDVGWIMSRSPIFPSGRDPFRENWSSTSAS